jgi:hypothetical protein
MREVAHGKRGKAYNCKENNRFIGCLQAFSVFFNLFPYFTKSCQDAPLLAVGRNGILVRGFGGQIPPTEQLAFFDGQVEAERARSA